MPSLFRFGPFQLDPSAYELRRNGEPVALERRPMDLLLCLLERPGELVSREEIARKLWGDGVFVDVESGINTAVRKLRKALQDPHFDAATFLQTIPGKGYRFAAPVLFDESTSPSSVCVAVLPVQALDATPDSQYLADGVTEELIAALGQASPSRIRVIGRTTMMRYQGSSCALALIAQQTRADFLVESTLRSEAESVRLMTRLIEAQGETQLWCASFDGDRRASVLALQREMSAALATQLHAQLSPGQSERVARRQPADPAAYDLFLRGRYLWHQLSAETTRRALEHFQRATLLDPDFVLAWAGIAVCLSALPITGDAASLQVIAPARHAAAQALRSAPHLAEAHTAEGFVHFWLDWDFVQAEACFRKALRLDSSDVIAHRTLAVVLAYQQRHAEAHSAAAIACELDPLNAANFALAAQVAFFSRDWPRALELAQRAIQVDPHMWVGYLQLAQAQERLQDYAAALESLRQAAPLSGHNSKVLALQGYIYGTTGRAAEAQALLQSLAARRSQHFVPPYADALISLSLGETDQAFNFLDRCIEVHDVHLTFTLVDAKWDPLRALPAYAQMLSRCGFHPAPKNL
ncbi:winged helix-turn-helix domain-containing protein [Nostoc sp. NIES-2111]